jgi:uncharacterized protein (TIGR02265 family)
MLVSEVSTQPRRLLFRQYAESFVNGIKPKMTGALKGDLRLSGLNLDKKLEPNYPAERINEWAVKAARHLFPVSSRDEGLRLLGHLLIEGWQRTMVGKATVAVMSIVSPKLAVSRITDYFRAGNNFTEATILEKGPTEYDVVMSEVNNVPWYYAGIIEAGAMLTKAKDPKLTLVATRPPGATFKLRWTAE